MNIVLSSLKLPCKTHGTCFGDRTASISLNALKPCQSKKVVRRQRVTMLPSISITLGWNACSSGFWFSECKCQTTPTCLQGPKRCYVIPWHQTWDRRMWRSTLNNWCNKNKVKNASKTSLKMYLLGTFKVRTNTCLKTAEQIKLNSFESTDCTSHTERMCQN